MPVFVKWSLENMCHVTKSGIFVTSSIFRQKKAGRKSVGLIFFYYFAMSCAILLATAAGSSGIMPSMSSACAYKRLQ